MITRTTCPRCAAPLEAGGGRRCPSCGFDLASQAAPPPPTPPPGAPRPAIQVQVYRAATQAEAARLFEQDALRAASFGYEVLSQAWEGSTLTVTYRLVVPAPPPAPTQATPLPPPGAPPGPPSPAASSVQTAAVALGIGGIMAAVGSILPWVGMGALSRSGIEGGGDGIITLILGIAMGLVALTAARDAGAARRGLAFLASLAVLGIAAYDIWHIYDVGREGQGSIFQIEPGVGLWLTAVGGLVGLVAASRLAGSERGATASVR